MDYILNQHLQSFAAEQTLKSLCLKIRKNILVEGVPKISIQDIPKQQLQWGKKKNSTRFDSSKVKSHRSELGQVSFLNFSSSKTIHRFHVSLVEKYAWIFFFHICFKLPFVSTTRFHDIQRGGRREKRRRGEI